MLYSVRSDFDPHYDQGRDLGDGFREIGGFVVHFFTESKIRRLAGGYRIREIRRFQEGRLPRDLFCVAMEKTAAPDVRYPEPRQEEGMSSPPSRFWVFMDTALARGAPDRKLSIEQEAQNPVSEPEDDTSDT